jgi:DNA repair photolyase
MNTGAQAILPLTPLFPSLQPSLYPAGRAAVARPAAGTGPVEYLELGVVEILNRPAGARAPFDWTINPYRGCELGCAHCPARYTHGFLGFHRWREFETRIFVKRGAAAALGRRLRTSALAGRPIAIGTAADPYQPAEERFGVTRSLLEAFARPGVGEGLALTLVTRSPLVLRDLDLLAALDRRHAITVEVPIPTLDADLAGRLEPNAPPPAARLEAVAALAGEGIATRVLCDPVLPGINAGEATLRPLAAAAWAAGAFDVAAVPLTLGPATRSRFMPWLSEEFPRLAPLYRRLYGRRAHLRQADRNRLLAPFRRLRLEHGFPRARPGRG